MPRLPRWLTSDPRERVHQLRGGRGRHRVHLRRHRQRPGRHLQHHRGLQLRPRRGRACSWPTSTGSSGRAGAGTRSCPWSSSSWSWRPLFALVVERRAHAPAVRRRPQHHDRGDPRAVPRAVRAGLDASGTRRSPATCPNWFAGDQVGVFGVNLSYEELITVGSAVAVASRCGLLFKRTRTGVSMRAVVDDPQLASLTGARTSRIAGYAWMIGFMLAGSGRDPARARHRHEHPDPVRAGDLRLRRGRSSGGCSSLPLTFLGAMILGVSDVPGHRLRPGQPPQRRHGDPAHGDAHRRPAPVAPGEAGRWAGRAPAAARGWPVSP